MDLDDTNPPGIAKVVVRYYHLYDYYTPSLYLCVYVYIYIHVYVYTYIYIYMYVYKYTYIYTYLYKYIYMFIFTYIHTSAPNESLVMVGVKLRKFSINRSPGGVLK
jgi:hypothetical protein